MNINESTLEHATIELFKTLGYAYKNGLDIAPDGESPERVSYTDVVLNQRLKDALYRINPTLPDDAVEETFKKIIMPQHTNTLVNNKIFHKYITDGIDVPYRTPQGENRFDQVRLFDVEKIENNEFLIVNQFTVIENSNNKRPDLVVFINGLPIAVIELKNPMDEDADIKKAFNQLQTYKAKIPSLFVYNELLIISDGLYAQVGSLTANFERFMPWRTVDGINIVPKGMPEVDALIQGIFSKERIVDIIHNFIVYEEDRENIIKKIAAYHQYFAVNKAVQSTITATSAKGDKRAGVVWHTQGSGKSILMVFYTAKLIKQPEMENPTIIVLTDRNDLDNQLFNTFSLSKEFLRTTPQQAESREDLRDKLQDRASGGIIFTTIQKFAPPTAGQSYDLLSDRRNIVVIVDEAHRTQYDFIDGFARNMRDGLPNASFIGFTGTPISFSDKNTQAVFGNYIDIYDIERAVEDGATVKIYYEARLAKISLEEEEAGILDEEFDEITENEEQSDKEKLKSKWSRLEAAVGTKERLALVAQDIVEHFEKRIETLDGKGMIVCMSRRICVDLYDAIIKLRPLWHSDDETGLIKVVMTGSSSDPLNYQQHLRSKEKQENIKKRVINPADSLKLIIVRDMWLTGFDAPCLHTMYVDKPMGGHNLMQAIARVNRVFRDKEGGLIVDYLGIAEDLKKALSHYTEGSRNNTGIDQNEAVAIMLEKYELVKDILHGFNYLQYIAKDITTQMTGAILAMDHILGLNKGKEKYLLAVTELSKAFALAVPKEEAMAIREEMAFFQLISANIRKHTVVSGKSRDDLDTALKQLVSKAVSSNEVIDIFSAVGLNRPEISILSDEFLSEIEKLPQKNLALEVLQKLLNDQIKVKFKKNVVLQSSFAEKLAETIQRYQSRTIEAAKVISELVALANEMKEAHARGENLGLTEDELAFYDALIQNESAGQILGDDILKAIARDLVESIKNNLHIDWNVKESVRAKIRVVIKRLLKKYHYPPDKREDATQLVLKQAEVLYPEFVNQ